MQNHRNRRIWLIAALLLCGTVSAILWHLWPQKYSLADPRRYVAIEDIPLEDRNSDLFLVNPVRWNYDTLMRYGILHSDYPNYSEDKELWRTWTNAYVIDFFSRIADNQPAVIRSTYRPRYHISELRYDPTPDGNGQLSTKVTHICCDEQCHALGLESESLDYFYYYDGSPFWYSISFPHGCIDFFLGSDSEQDQLIETLIDIAVEKGICKLD